MLNNLSKKEKLLISVTIIVGVLCLYFNFIFIPSVTSIINKTSIIDDYNKQVQNIKDTKDKNKKLSSNLTTLQGKFDETSKELPYSERIPEIIHDIKPLIDASGATYGPVSFGKSAEYLFTIPGTKTKVSSKDSKETRLMSFSVNLAESGNYISLMKLIDSIETIKTNNRIATIDNISFSPSPTTVEATIGVHYYFLTDSKDNNLKYEFVNTGVFGKDNPFK